MKYAVTLLLVLATANVNAWQVPDFGSGPLHDDLKEFLQLFPLEQVQAILKEYNAQDVEYQQFVKLLKEEFKYVFAELQAIPQAYNFFSYLHKNGIDIFKHLNILNSRFGLSKIEPPNTFAISGGLKGLINDLKAVFPMKAYAQLYKNKMATSTAFQDFMRQVRSPEVRAIGPILSRSPHYQTILNFVRNAGIDLQTARKIVNIIFGVPSVFNDFLANRSLQDELDDFAALIPVKQITAIIKDYIKNDGEVQAALRFARSEEFHNLVYEVEALPEYQGLVLYLQAAGLNIIEYIQTMHSTLGMRDYVPPVAPYFDMIESMSLYANRGVAGLVNDIKAVIPFAQMKALYNQKLKESPVFAEFIAKLSSPQIQNIVNALYKNPTYLKLVNQGKAAGLDLVALRNLLTSMLGIHFPSTY